MVKGMWRSEELTRTLVYPYTLLASQSSFKGTSRANGENVKHFKVFLFAFSFYFSPSSFSLALAFNKSSHSNKSWRSKPFFFAFDKLRELSQIKWMGSEWVRVGNEWEEGEEVLSQNHPKRAKRSTWIMAGRKCPDVRGRTGTSQEHNITTRNSNYCGHTIFVICRMRQPDSLVLYNNNHHHNQEESKKRESQGILILTRNPILLTQM